MDEGEQPTFHSNMNADRIEGIANESNEVYTYNQNNTTLGSEEPSEHLYLGNMDDTIGYILLDDHSEHLIPLMITSADFDPVPTQIFPIIERDKCNSAALKYSVENGLVFGCISRHMSINGLNRNCSVVGTTAQVLKYSFSNDATVGLNKIKAVGRQRYKLLDIKSKSIKLKDGTDISIKMGMVKILPELLSPSFPATMGVPSLNRYRRGYTRKLCLERDMKQMPYPKFVYDQYEEMRLMEKIKNLIGDSCQAKSLKLSLNASDLSFQMLKIVPLSKEFQQRMMTLNNPIERLRCELNLLQKLKGMVVSCTTCGSLVAEKMSVFAMSGTGPHGTYVNNFGYLHELVTVSHVKAYNVRDSTDPPSLEFTWFPGYAWNIISCRCCGQHLGWKFTAAKADLTPNHFWGLVRDSIKMDAYDDSDEQGNA